MTDLVRGIRGATTLDADTREQVLERTGILLREMLERNAVPPDRVVSLFFTATDDIRSEFPAAAAREIGLRYVPLLCARELDIVDSVDRCIRILMIAYTERAPSEIRHVYLERARPLRTDLPQ